MNLETRYANHPEDVKGYDTETLRRHFLVERVFVTGDLSLTYSHVDRVVFGGAVPTTQALALEGGKAFGTPNFLDRRELGVVNVGAAGKAIVNSPLVKTAIYGNDPNVGRLISSLGDFLGNHGLAMPSDRMTVTLCGLEVFRNGAFYLSAETEVTLSTALLHARQDPLLLGFPQHDRFVDIEVRVAPAAGSADTGGSAEVLGSDLGYEYVKENADYRS